MLMKEGFCRNIFTAKNTMWRLVLLTLLIDHVSGQGRLLMPPGRSSMWRLGYNTPVNYNDNALSCGGVKV